MGAASENPGALISFGQFLQRTQDHRPIHENYLFIKQESIRNGWGAASPLSHDGLNPLLLSSFAESIQPRYQSLRCLSVIEILRTKGICERVFLNAHTIQRRDKIRNGTKAQGEPIGKGQTDPKVRQ